MKTLMITTKKGLVPVPVSKIITNAGITAFIHKSYETPKTYDVSEILTGTSLLMGYKSVQLADYTFYRQARNIEQWADYEERKKYNLALISWSLNSYGIANPDYLNVYPEDISQRWKVDYLTPPNMWKL